MQENLSIRFPLKVAVLLAIFALGACAMPDAKTAGTGKARIDPDDQEYVTGSRFPVKDRSQTNVQTGTDLQSSGARGN